MQIVGFNFTKVSAEKAADFTAGSEISTDIKFVDIAKEETDFAKEGSEAMKASFEFKVSYGKKEKKGKNPLNGDIILNGFIILMATGEEANDVQKAWKNKELPQNFKMPIFNFLLKKCSMKALQLEEELGLPLHLPMPHISPAPANKDEKK